MPKYSFKNKFAVVTGASSGIGKAISLCLAKKGAKLFLTSHPREIETLAGWCKELKTKYINDVFYSVADLSDKDGPKNLYKSVKEKIDSPDILINNAGILSYGKFHEIPLKDQIKIVDVNARAYMVLMHLFMQNMIKKGEGRILNVSSVAAFQPTSFHSVYGATKAFVQNLSEAVKYDAKGTGVKICTLNP
ncbi:MAG: SDR family NAD(P)-dependent oxidoreductase, partial [Desulfobacteraceae bacterium]|nr:SDR family NAD(P)-dependent oxidoreductase [Desulfobacteraceae bacterium]